MVEFRMPSLGADMEAGTLVEWLVKPGDWVKHGDIIAVVETQKGAIEIETFQSGQIEQILVNLKSKVPVGTPLALIRTEPRRKARRCGCCSAAESAGDPARGTTISTSARSAAVTTVRRARHRGTRARITSGAAARPRTGYRSFNGKGQWSRWGNHLCRR